MLLGRVVAFPGVLGRNRAWTRMGLPVFVPPELALAAFTRLRLRSIYGNQCRKFNLVPFWKPTIVNRAERPRSLCGTGVSPVYAFSLFEFVIRLSGGTIFCF